MKLVHMACVASIIALSSPALAQDASTGSSSVSPQDGDIIVTALRQSTLLSKTPITLSAIGGDDIKTTGITDARRLTEFVPNVSLTSGSNGVLVSIRGVSSSDVAEKGDPSAAFLLDGIYIARPQSLTAAYYDLERVEVLRGPQGTLYGRNTTAGVINAISARPKDTFEASLDGSYGNLNTTNDTAMVNVGLGNGLGIRAAVNYQRQDPYFTLSGPQTVKSGPLRDTLSARLSFGGTTGNLSFVIRGEYSQSKAIATSASYVTLDNFYDMSTVTVGRDPVFIGGSAKERRLLKFSPTIQGRSNNKTYSIMGEFVYDAGPVELTYLGGYRRTELDATYNTIFVIGNNQTDQDGTLPEQQSHELRLAFGKDSPLHGQAGIYYFREKTTIETVLGQPLAGFVSPTASGFGIYSRPSLSSSRAAFGQITYDITPDLHVTGGIRYTDDKKSWQGAQFADFPDVASSFCGQLRCVLAENNAARRFKKATWRAGIDYDAPNLGLFYASVSTGYKAGSFNPGCEVGTGPTCGLTTDQLYYEPETLTAYEVGAKLRISDAFRFNIAAFHYDYNNLQVNQAVIRPTPMTLTSNAAKAKIDGVEVEATLKPSRNDTVNLSYSYTDARYTSFVASVLVPNALGGQDRVTRNFSGLPLDRAPKHIVMASYTHAFPLANGGQVDAGVRTRLSSGYYLADLAILGQYRQPSYTKSDVTLTYNAPDKRYYVQAFAQNIENEITIAQATSGLGALVYIEEPRTYGVRAGVKF
ncbi:TonB-dependent receptor [Sphingobium sp. HBC34]|uniref:TonB-dependent receptor n=1 Tax=Sphingobium cyanobacteriorum TaxID=3063954 RepID=A0ABT8ZSD2_9SPHN|nr:TonB-dependent receptor [Sphingobium sp. HBC34]MDO7836635.1 TonB-dependent receptor [Sphingobium sp. HBC34]